MIFLLSGIHAPDSFREQFDRPALSQLMDDIQYGLIDCVVVYKVDRLSRSLLDFAKLVALFDEHNVSFVSVTQQFSTTTSMGRLADKYPGRTVKRDGDEIVVTIPVNFHRRNGRQFVKAKRSEADKVDRNEINETLVSEITKAFAWQEELESGEYDSIERLAKAKNVGRTYAGRVLRLTSLAPKLVEDIINGNEHELTLRKLHGGFDPIWLNQPQISDIN